MKLAVFAVCASIAAAHGAVSFPPPRNAVDKDLAPWNGAVPSHPPGVESDTGWCPVPGPDGKPSGQNGQSCFWFSNGCAIGCSACDGTSRGPIPSSKNPLNVRKFNWCPDGTNSTAKATICDKALRTVNRGVDCGAADDWYYYSPWRAPGSAPVFDSCGMAGGHKPPNGGYGGIYVNTTHAKLGDKGTDVLPATPSGATWKAGDSVEVAWTIEANHAGGYQYRLCPKDSTLDEDCFQKTPLDFTGLQSLRWGGKSGTQISFNGTYVTGDQVVPKGSMWVVNPIPRNDKANTGEGFPPHCDESKGYKCSGMMDGNAADPTLEIVDRVLIPASLPAGAYVLGWRWDCEESNQIWQSCSDVTITN